jgi:hypothetical protein
MLRRFIAVGLVGFFLVMSFVVAEDNIGPYNPIADVNKDGARNMGSSQMVCFTVDSSLYEPWETSFIGLDGYPMIGFTAYDGRLYATSNNNLYIYDGTGWSVLEAPAYVTSLMPYENKLIIGGQGGLYSYNGSSFSLVFPVSNYIKVLGVYNKTLYAGTFLDKPPALYYCSGSPDNPNNWHVDNGFSTILNFSGPFGSIDSFAVYDNAMFVSSGGTVYSYNGIEWSIAASYDDTCAFLDLQVYNSKLYLATRDQGWRRPFYQGGTGFSGRVIEFDGENWTTVFDHDYWIYSLEVYDNKLYVGTAEKIYAYNGTNWETSFNATEGAYYAISMMTYDSKIYVGMGNGYIFSHTSAITANFAAIESDLTSPSGAYRWLDSADQAYATDYRNNYNYSQAAVTVTYFRVGKTLTGRLVAKNLKPNFAYQLKLVGAPGTVDNEQIGLAGRWWQEEWNGSSWSNGQNLNNKGNGSSPNPNDLVYFAKRFTEDPSSPTGYHYRYTGYLLFAYFITDENGDATIYFETGSCYHVLWKTNQRSRTANDGPIHTATFDPDPSQAAYDADYPNSTISIFGEWERLPIGGVNLALGQYSCQMVLTEESFHGTSPLAGNWAAAMSVEISFTITE